LDDLNENQDVNTSGKQEGTSKKEPETFTKEQYDEGQRKAKSDALADIGRYKKSADDSIRAAQAAEERINRMLKEQEDAELDANRDDADKLGTIRERQARRKAESELDKMRQELEDEKAKTVEAQEADAKHTKEQNAREVASRLEVDAKVLLKHTDGSKEAMEDLAKELLQKGEKKTLKTVTGETIGGGSSFEQIRDAMIKNPSNDAIMKRYIEAKKARDGQ